MAKKGDTHYNFEEKERALALLDQEGGIYKRVSKITGISAPTLKRWHESRDLEEVEKVRSEERGKFIKKAWKTINVAIEKLENKIPDATPKELAIIIGILFDKVTKVDGASSGFTIEETRRLQLKNISDEDLDKAIRKLNPKEDSIPRQIDV